MKHVLCTMAAIFIIGYSMNAQTADLANHSRGITNFRSSVENMDVLVKWTSNNNENSNYWEVQGSADGKSFSTIGMVMGADPKDVKTYTFKQKLQKIKPGIIYFRVMHIEKNATDEVSNIIRGAS